MLGLVTHEPHFCLLREEVKFGKSAKRQTSVDAVTFHLLHLSILREYLDYEFASLKVSCFHPSVNFIYSFVYRCVILPSTGHFILSL